MLKSNTGRPHALGLLFLLNLGVLLSFFTIVGTCKVQAQDCSESTKSQLIAAGVTSNEIQKLCINALPFFDNSVSIIFPRTDIEQFVNALAPFPIQISSLASQDSERFFVTSLLYCGTNDSGAGRFLGILTREEPRVPHGFIMLEGTLVYSDCDLGVVHAAERVRQLTSQLDESTLLAHVTADWRPWALRFTVLEALEVVESKEVQRSNESTEFATSGFSIAVGRRDVNLNAAMQFLPDALLISIVPSHKVEQIDQRDQIPDLTRIPGFGKSETLGGRKIGPLVSVQIEALNYFLDHFFGGGQTLIVVRDDPVFGTVRLSNLKAGIPTRGRMWVSGVFTYENNDYDARVDLIGSNLQIDNITVSGYVERCPDALRNWKQALECSSQNALRASLAKAASQVLSSKYRGQLLQQVGRPSPIEMDANGRTALLTINIQKIEAEANALVTSTTIGFYKE